MKKTFSSKKSAFSLIELSIVLIVIGLLVAGVTGGASLIKSSELRSVMSEARGYSVAVSGFFSQFNALPGTFDSDLGKPSDVTLTIDPDGKIQYCNNCNSSSTTWTGSDSTVAWFQLDKAGAIDFSGKLSSAASEKQAPITNFPSSKVKSAGWVFDYNANSSQNVVILTAALEAAAAGEEAAAGKTSPATDDGFAQAVITPSDALSIDTKIDDGKANSGKIRAAGTASSSATTGCYLADSYNVSVSDKACAITYQVDVNS